VSPLMVKESKICSHIFRIHFIINDMKASDSGVIK
jgi:hypothetical protein